MSKHPDPKQDQSNAAGGAHQQSAYPLDQYTVASKSQGGGGDQSPYYKSAAPTISMPKGGGALKGIDEKFTVNAVNGTASLQIPFPLTPGRGGFTPSLSVDYNSGSGNSEFGLGWSLSLPSIQRRTNKKLPRYNDTEESDVFLLAGAEDMIPKLDFDGTNWIPDEDPALVISSGTGAGTYNIKRYRPRIEGLFARIEHIRKVGTPGSWWKVTSKENIVTFYGFTARARLSDPEDPERIFKWLPEFSYDNKGNLMSYFYLNEDTASVPLTPHEHNRLNGTAPFSNVYLSGVAYCNKTPFIVGPDNAYDMSSLTLDYRDFLMQAVLDYGDHDLSPAHISPGPSWDWPLRKDPFSDFHAGFEIRTYRLCRSIMMYHFFDELNGGDPVLVRSVELSYFGDISPDTYLEADYITSFTQSGFMLKPDPADGYYKKSLPPVTLTHAPLAWDNTIHNVSREDAENAPQGLTGGYQWLDLWGEGLPGILSEQGHGWFYKENQGDGHFSPALQIANKPSLQGLGHDLQWSDLDADGRRQLVSHNPALPGYYELNDDQQWEPFRNFKDWINVDWQSPYTKMLDLDGDGRPDLLLTEERAWRWYENEGKDGFTLGGESSVDFDEERKPRLLHNDLIEAIFLADMNGDGMTDIVRIQNGAICYWPNMGYGRFGAKVTMSNAPVFDRPEMFDPHYLSIADVSGTGAPDIIYIGQNKCAIWINLAGNAWGEKYDKILLPEISPETKISILDFLGNGTPCIVWSSPLPQHAHAPLRYIDLMGGNKPYLMDTYSNGMGKLVEVTYKQSTKYFLEDKQKGKPWATSLPFPVHCIESIKTSDLVSQTSYTQLFSYHHGYYDHEEREFRGFGRVETIDTDSAKSFMPDGATPHNLDQFPVLTKTWHHTGAWMRERTLLEAFADEYYLTGWAELPIAPDLPMGLSPQEQREAYRSLKGQPLRQEVYALDGAVSGALAGVPYTVATHSYAILKVQAVEDNRYGSFLSYQQQGLDWSAERNASDPRVVHHLTLSVDELGYVLESATVCYPRDPAIVSAMLATAAALTPPVDLSIVGSVQGQMLATYNVNVFTTDGMIGGYHLRLPCEARSYEITGLSISTGTLWSPVALSRQIHGFAPLSIPPASEIEYASSTGGGITIRQLSFARTLYLQDDTLAPLAFGSIEPLAIPYNHYQLAFTNGILNGPDYYSGLLSGTVLADGGYIDETLIPGFPTTGTNRYWIPGGLVDYDITNFYTPIAFHDSWGHTTTLSMWGSYYLLLESTTDPVLNTDTVLVYNWYNLQPSHIKDINDNESQMLYDALGMPVAAVVMSKDGSGTNPGDTLSGIDPNTLADVGWQGTFFSNPESVAQDLLNGASWRCVYDLGTMPVAVGMIAREQHDSELHDSPKQIRLTYTDGFGRLAMHKVQAAADEFDTSHTIRWIGNGKVIYNNKGNAVMHYEPYFTDTPLFDYEAYAAIHGVTARIHYDALGRVIKTDLPDGSFTKAEWDGWTHLTYDNNDTVASSQWYIDAGTAGGNRGLAAAKALIHDNTPTTTYLDTLGRGFYIDHFNRVPDPAGPLTLPWLDEHYYTYYELDISGNHMSVNDVTRSITPVRFKYDMHHDMVKKDSVDSGVNIVLSDINGIVYYSRDPILSKFYKTFDALRRLVTRTVTPLVGPAKVLEHNFYGEGIASDRALNLRGKLYQFYDGGGTEIINKYDFMGRAISFTRKFALDYTQHPNWTSISSVAMEPGPGYNSYQAYDALGRTTTITTPEGAITTYSYDEGGLLFKIDVSGVHSMAATDIVKKIFYDAHNRRIKIRYQNGARTIYKYDPYTFRVTRIKTTRPDGSGGYEKLQDLNYWYDPVGNITLQIDAALQTVYFDNGVASPDNDYTYDALYRLVIAMGRERTGDNNAPRFNDATRSGIPLIPAHIATAPDPSIMRNYTQYYIYDNAGNMLQMKHTTTGGTGNWTRNFTLIPGTNMLHTNDIGSNNPLSETYNYDPKGNLAGGMNHLSAMVSNEDNHLETVTDVLGNIITSYQYDSSGRRIRKVTMDNNTNIRHDRKYFGDWEVYQNITPGSSSGTFMTPDTLNFERETLHIMDDEERIALIDTPTVDNLGTAEVQLLRYHFSNHLSTATLELDDSAAIISYEEYHPYGTTSFQAGRNAAEVSLKRYRYTAKEKDNETGFYYHGARYYCPWLARWIETDPLEYEFAPMSPYNYGDCNPISYQDSTGLAAKKKKATGSSDGGGTYSTMPKKEKGKQKKEPKKDPKKDPKKKEEKKKEEKKKDPKKKEEKKKDEPKPKSPSGPNPNVPPAVADNFAGRAPETLLPGNVKMSTGWSRFIDWLKGTDRKLDSYSGKDSGHPDGYDMNSHGGVSDYFFKHNLPTGQPGSKTLDLDEILAAARVQGDINVDGLGNFPMGKGKALEKLHWIAEGLEYLDSRRDMADAAQYILHDKNEQEKEMKKAQKESKKAEKYANEHHLIYKDSCTDCHAVADTGWLNVGSNHIHIVRVIR